MTRITGILGLLALVGCAQQPDGSMSLTPPPENMSEAPTGGIQERVAALQSGPFLSGAVSFRDGLLTIGNATGQVGKVDGSIAISGPNLVAHMRYITGQPTPPKFGWLLFDYPAYGYGCAGTMGGPWYAVAEFNVTTDVFFCGGPFPGAQESTGSCKVTLGSPPTMHDKWGGEYTVAGDGDGTGQRHGIMAYNGFHQAWEILVRKYSEVHSLSPTRLNVCGNGGNEGGPGVAGGYMWLAIDQ